MKKKNHVKKILELGCGQGRDTLFFASKGIDVTALDFSSVAIDGLIKDAKGRNLLNNIYASIFDPRNKPIPFSEDEFDTVYSHMFFNMHFTWEQLKFMFQEIRRVLRSNGFDFFSVRNHNDKSYGKGKKIDNHIYDISGFQIRFFIKQHVNDLVKGDGFEILDIKEIYEEPVTLYLVSTRKTKLLTMFNYSKKFHEYSVCVLDVLILDAYQKMAKIADHQVSVQIVVGKSVVAGIV